MRVLAHRWEARQDGLRWWWFVLTMGCQSGPMSRWTLVTSQTSLLGRCGICRLNVTAAQGLGVGRFAVDAVAEEARRRGQTRLTVLWERGKDRPEGVLLPKQTDQVRQGGVATDQLAVHSGDDWLFGGRVCARRATGAAEPAVRPTSGGRRCSCVRARAHWPRTATADRPWARAFALAA